MSIIKTGIAAHDTVCNTAEMNRQVADDKAKATFLAGGTDAAYQTALNNNAITHYRAIIASAIANGLSYTPASEALHRLTGSN